jgi:hypothetical protein
VVQEYDALDGLTEGEKSRAQLIPEALGKGSFAEHLEGLDE